MDFRYAMSFVFEVHLPFIREYNKENILSQAGEEGRFFEHISETLIPLLEVIERLSGDHVPFQFALAVSPVICHMLNDEHLINKYLHYIDKQIEFGQRELQRTKDNEELNKLALAYCNKITERKTAFTEKYEKDILKALDVYRKKGKLEILASCATNAFLPFISHNEESIQAQMEIPVSNYRNHFSGTSHGFWLPALGWTEAIEPYLRAYNFSYTIVESHGLLFGSPLPEKGTFYPVKTPNGTFILGRDYHSLREIEKFSCDESYRNNDRDVGYELPPEAVNQFLSAEGERHKTGYKYWTRSGNGNAVYNPQTAAERAARHAKQFLENNAARLKGAAKKMKETPLCLFAHNIDNFGRFWHEGPLFIESLFRTACGYKDLKIITPSEYIFKQDLSSMQVTAPEFSSSGNNGYAESWLNVSNDWIYRHLVRSMERMTELAERFPDDTGLKERALNQAAREILLAQSSDWSLLLYRQDSTEYARCQAENALRNFTTIYEALGSNYISTEWLTTLERRHNIFPNINYRIFRRKK